MSKLFFADKCARLARIFASFGSIALTQAHRSAPTIGLALGLILFDASSAALAQSVSTVDLTGSEKNGQLVDLSNQRISVATATGIVEADPSELARLQFHQAAASDIPAGANPLKVMLTDGTQLNVSSIESSENGWLVHSSLAVDPSISIPKDSLAWVQFVDLKETAAASWKDLLTGEQTADILTVLRNDDLESLNGAIVRITRELVEFELDGQLIPAPRAKVAGLIWLRRETARVTQAVELLGRDGSRLRSKELSLTTVGEQKVVQMETLAGLRMTIPIKNLVRIDYSSANLQWLDQVEVLESASLVTGIPTAIAETRNKLLAPKLLAKPAETTGKTGSQHADLLFVGPGKFVFRVPDGYTRLLAVIQRNRSATVLTPVTITVKSDGQEVWSFRFDSDAMRAELEANVAANKRCEITVQADAPMPFGSHITLEQPRLMP